MRRFDKEIRRKQFMTFQYDNPPVHIWLLVRDFLAKHNRNHVSATELSILGPLRLFPSIKSEKTEEKMEIFHD